MKKVVYTSYPHTFFSGLALPELRPGSPAESAAITPLMAIAADSAVIANTLVFIVSALKDTHEGKNQST